MSSFSVVMEHKLGVHGGRNETGEVKDEVRPWDLCLGDSSLNSSAGGDPKEISSEVQSPRFI